MNATLLSGLLFVLVGALVTPGAYRALKSGKLRVRGGAIVKREDQAFAFWTSALVQAFVGFFLLVGGAAAVIASFIRH